MRRLSTFFSLVGIVLLIAALWTRPEDVDVITLDYINARNEYFITILASMLYMVAGLISSSLDKNHKELLKKLSSNTREL